MNVSTRITLLAAGNAIMLGYCIYAYRRADRVEEHAAVQRADDRSQPAEHGLAKKDPTRPPLDAPVPAQGGSRKDYPTGTTRALGGGISEVELLASASMLDGYQSRFRGMNLEPSAQKAFNDLLLRRALAKMALRQKGKSQNAGNIDAGIAAIESQFSAEAIGVIGTDNFEKHKRFERTLEWQLELDRLESRLSFTREPLFEEQREELLFALAPSPDEKTSLSEETLARANSLLTPMQMAFLKEQLDSRRALQRMQQIAAEHFKKKAG